MKFDIDNKVKLSKYMYSKTGTQHLFLVSNTSQGSQWDL